MCVCVCACVCVCVHMHIGRWEREGCNCRADQNRMTISRDFLMNLAPHVQVKMCV